MSVDIRNESITSTEKTALLCDRHMVDETRAIEVSVEALWFLQEDEVRPAAAARHDSHIFLGADQPLGYHRRSPGGGRP